VSVFSPAELAGRVPSVMLGLVRTPDDVLEGRPCVCGEMVWANPHKPTEGVAVHNLSVAHGAWWELEMEAWGEE
jgi:hypothetical protein